MRFERSQKLPESECPRGEHWRNRVEFDDDFGLTMVAEEKVTSAGPRAQVVEATTLEWTEESVRWHLEVFRELVAAWDARRSEAEGVRRVRTTAQPQNDVTHFEALRIVATAARDLHEIFLEDDSTPEDVASAMEPLGNALARVKKIESQVSPIRPDPEEDDEDDL